MASARGTIVLMGSGELTATMVEVHKELLARLGSSPRAVFVDTPAGFQLNADQISRKAVEYFRNRVQQALSVASLKSAQAATPYEAEQALHALRQADYILVGPGSPTYAVRQWRQTPVPEILAKRIEEGACLVAASAAALTVGCFTLPVYEIYKVGEDVHWVDGMNLLGRFGFNTVVVPHWNNAEGGTHDTRFCYMGESRFRKLEALLPESVGIMGIDEHTACILDLATEEAVVKGIGRVTYRHGDAEVTFERGDSIPLDVLRGKSSPREGWTQAAPNSGREAPVAKPPEDAFWDTVRSLEAAFRKGLEAHDSQGAATVLLELDRFLWSAQQSLQEEGAIVGARDVLRELIALLGMKLASSPPSAQECLAPLVEGFLELREQLREQKKWAEADAIRDLLQREKIVVEDTGDGSRWHLIR